MNATEKTWTINDIKAAVRASGSHWFDPDSMRFFRCKVLPMVYQGPHGIYFVTSEQCDDHSPRMFSVRQFTPADSSIDTIGDFNSISTREAAIGLAKASAGYGFKTASQDFAEVTVQEQFLHDLHKAGYSKATPAWVARMMELHKRHDKACCDWCNGDAGTPTKLRSVIRAHAKKIGVGVLLGGDPRGCVTKIVAEGLEPNDFAKEGYCVPIEREDD